MSDVSTQPQRIIAEPLVIAPLVIPALGAKRLAAELHGQLGALNTQYTQLYNDYIRLYKEFGKVDGLAVHERQERIAGLDATIAANQQEIADQERQLAELRKAYIDTQEAIDLQSVGVFNDSDHPLEDSIEFEGQLKELRDRIKVMAKADGGALETPTSVTMDGSAAKGKKMTRDFGKIMLRAYNAEADRLVRILRPYKLPSAQDRLTKARDQINKSFPNLNVAITASYHRLRLKELEIAAQFLEAKERAKELAKEQRRELQEAKRVEQELARQREALEKERQHNRNALERLEAAGADPEAIDALRRKLDEIDKSIEDVDFRAANVRAGYVYVISNVGSFGDGVVKIGMTRRLEPMDRVNELGDASVPFRFDVHALFFTDDAVGIEAELHRRFEDRRLNLVNRRREFFRATPHEVREVLSGLGGNILEFNEEPEAPEWRLSGGPQTATAP